MDTFIFIWIAGLVIVFAVGLLVLLAGSAGFLGTGRIRRRRPFIYPTNPSPEPDPAIMAGMPDVTDAGDRHEHHHAGVQHGGIDTGLHHGGQHHGGFDSGAMHGGHHGGFDAGGMAGGFHGGGHH